MLLSALVIDALLRLESTLHQFRAHRDVALNVVNDPQDKRFEIRPAGDDFELRVLRPRAQDDDECLVISIIK